MQSSTAFPLQAWRKRHREVTLRKESEPCSKTLQLHLQTHQTLELAMGAAWEAEGNRVILLVGALWTFAEAFISLGKGEKETEALLKNMSPQLTRFILSLDSVFRQQWFQSIFCTSLLLIRNGNRNMSPRWEWSIYSIFWLLRRIG